MRVFGSCLLMAAVLFSGTTAWAERTDQGQAAVKVDHQPLFTALDQRMRRNTASYTYDPQIVHDPFLSIRAVRGHDPATYPPIPRHSVITQLKLVAITMLSDHPRVWASFEDGAGTTYDLRVGDRIGPQNAQVVKISSSMVTIETPVGEPGQPPRITEIKLPIPGQTAGLSRAGQALQIQRAE